MTKQNLLTAHRVQEILKSGIYKTYHDGMGLLLVGSPTYKVFSWKQRIYTGTVTGKARDIGLGSAREVSLAKARAKGRALRELARDGIDPIEKRRRELAEARAEASACVVFKDAAEEFLSVFGPTWKNAKHRHQWRSAFANHVYRKIGSVPVSEIDAALVNETVMPLFAKAPETGRRVRERILRVTKWIADGRPPPTFGGNGAAKHHAALPYAHIPSFMAKLRARPGVGAVALEFCILTACRTGEILGARWDEIDYHQDKLWVIPGERMKGGKTHTVPLSDRAIEILQSLPQDGEFVFAGRFGGAPNSQLLLETLKKIDPALTVHGMRASFRDWSGDCTNTPKDVIEHALAHQLPNKTEAAYRRGSAIEKRRVLMQLWAKFCSMPAEGATVVKLHG